MEIPKLKFYAVQNSEGKWFRAKGYGGSGESWVSELSKAKIYGKIGPARAVASYWFIAGLDAPKIVVFDLCFSEILNEEARIKSSFKKKLQKKVSSEIQRKMIDLSWTKREIERLKKKKDAIRESV